LGHECRRERAGLVSHLGKDHRAGLDFADAAERVEVDHCVQPRSLFHFRFSQANPRLQPSFSREL
jgi:hypothetical protein